MGKGCAQLGKPVKGRNKEKKEKKSDDVDKQLANDLSMLEEYERLSKLADIQRERLKNLHQQEIANVKVNQKILLSIYRKFMREEKVENLRKEAEILAQNHIHDTARKDAIIEVLIRDIDTAENQLLTARRCHVLLLEKLLQLQETKIASADDSFEKNLLALKKQYHSEIDEITRLHARNVNEITEVLHISNETDKERALAAKNAHEIDRERVRNGNLENLNELRITQENRIDDLERYFEEAHANYMQQTQEKNTLFKILQKQDKIQAKKLRRRQRTQEKTIKEQASWRQRQKTQQASCAVRHADIKQQIALVQQQCASLKGHTNHARKQEEEKQCNTTLHAREALQTTNKYIEKAALLLHMAELCRKMETERERVLPVDPGVAAGALALTKNQSAAEGQLASVEQGIGVGIGTGAGEQTNVPQTEDAVDWSRLDHLMKKCGKIKLEKIAIEQERARLKEENATLKAMLEQYLAGVAVREDAVSKPNPLLIVNGAVGLADAPTLRASEARVVNKVVIEGAVAAKQIQYTGGQNRPTVQRF